MLTICPSEDCNQKYKIKPELIGSMGRCKKCNNIFTIEEFKEKPKIFELGLEDDETHEEEASQETRKRRSPKEIMEENIALIKYEVNDFLPRLNNSLEKQESESDTRLLINKMLQKILGYKLEDIKTEQKIEGKRADYVLSIRDKDVMVIEAKKIGMALKERQIFQATSYGAYSGIEWVILTNAVVWQLFHISTGEKIENDLVFTIDLRDGLDDDEANFFYLISKAGMMRKNLLKNLWGKISALCYDNIVNAILTDQVISKIRTTLSKQTGQWVTNEELRDAIEENIFQLE
jgi:predicted type IV restriction endonuclease